MHRIEGLIDIFLQPGEFFVADAEYQMRTMLGSCVSITLWHPHKRIGAMSHFLLPTRGISDHSAGLDARYGDEAMELMVQDLRKEGVVVSQCQGKVFGGGNMFPDQRHSSAINVGLRNGEAALELLNRHGVPILSESLFGIGHRQIIFDIRNGDVWCHQVAPSNSGQEPVGDML
jgi:chemotaxis protein CheD